MFDPTFFEEADAPKSALSRIAVIALVITSYLLAFFFGYVAG